MPDVPAALWDQAELGVDYDREAATSRAKRYRERQRQYMDETRSEDREIEIPEPRDPENVDACRLDLRRFAGHYFPELFSLQFGEMHLEIIRELQEAILRGGKIALAAPRGSGKTTIVQVAVLWAVLYGHSRFVVLVTAEGGMARRRLKDLKRYLAREDSALVADFPSACAPVVALEGSPQRAGRQTVAGQATELLWGVDEIQLARVDGAPCSQAIIVAKGLDAAIRGLVVGERRPDLVILDDPQTHESANSASQTSARNEIIKQDLEGLSGPDRPLTVVSLWTVIRKGDLADQYTSDLEPDYWSMRYKALSSMPESLDLAEEYISRVREAKRLGDRKARSAHAWYLRRSQGRGLAGHALEAQDIEAGFLATWQERYIQQDVGDRAMAEAIPGEDLSWALEHHPDLMRQEEVSAIQHQLNRIAGMGWAAWRSEYQNDPLDPFADRVAQIEPHVIAERLTRLDRGVVPAWCDRVTAFVDLGGYERGQGLHWGVAAWGRGMSGSVIDYGRDEVTATGAGIEADIRTALAKLVEALAGRAWLREDGARIAARPVLIDAHWQSETVYRFCEESHLRGSLMPSMGFGLKPGRQLYRSVPKGAVAGDGWIIAMPQNSAARCMLCRFDANRRKTFAAERLLTPDGQPGRLMLFGRRAEDHRAFCAQVASERRTRYRSDSGVTVDIWTEAQENHMWDVVVGLVLGASVTGLKLEDTHATPRPGPAVRKAAARARVRRAVSVEWV